MTAISVGDVDAQVREVEEAEVAAYLKQGWAVLPGLVSRDLALALLGHLKQVTGLDYDELPRDHPDAQAVTARIREQGMDKMFSMPRLQDDLVWQVAASHALGEASAQLTGIHPMRIMTDGVLCKLPDWTNAENLMNGPGNGTYTGATPWHQDYISMPMDRIGGIQFWMALSEITPDMGTIQYLTGSHREYPLGAVHYGSNGQTMQDVHPELWEKYETSPQHHLHAGDVVAHHPLVMHAAEPNRTDRLRWAYQTFRIPADTLYNGIPFTRFTEYGFNFQQWEPYDHPKFPIVSD